MERSRERRGEKNPPAGAAGLCRSGAGLILCIVTKDGTVSANVPRSASHAWRRVQLLLLGPRVRPILLLALLGFVIFGVFRAGLLLRRWNAIEDLHAPDVWRCFLMGLRFDAVPIGFALLPLTVALPLAPRRLFRNRLFR